MNQKEPIQIVSFPDDTQFTSNTINIDHDIFDFRDENQILDHKGVYNITSSSYYDNTSMPFNAFNASNKLFWKTNNIGNSFEFSPSVIAYTKAPYKVAEMPGAPSIYQGGGTNSSNFFKTTVLVPGGTSDTIYGEWLQIQLPKKLRISKYSILTPEAQNNIQYFPLEFTIVGSHNGEEWYYVDQQKLSKPPDVSKRLPIVFSLKNGGLYSYYRLIISTMPFGNDCVRLNQWNLFGMPEIENKENFEQMSTNMVYRDLNSYNNIFSNFSISKPLPIREVEFKNINKIENIDFNINIFYIILSSTILFGTVGYIISKYSK